MTREQWLKERLSGIGASEAAAVMGMSPYMTSVELWEFKTGQKEPEDISYKEFVRYGIEAEKPLRDLFALDFPQYAVSHEEYKIIRNEQRPYIFCSPDGELLHKDTGERGGLQIKTTEIFSPRQWSEWDNRIPDHYYVQELHEMLAAGWAYIWLKAQIKWMKDGQMQLTTRHYFIDRREVQQDIDMLEHELIKFWGHIERRERPPLKLPPI